MTVRQADSLSDDFELARYEGNRQAGSLSDPLLLRATDITKSFAGVHALRGASLELCAREVHALIGENGAGKSTLIRIITGVVQPDGGHVEVDGHVIAHNSPAVARSLGIAAIYQQPALFPDLSVAENIALGLETAGPWKIVDWRRRRRRAVELLDRVGGSINVDTRAAELSVAQQQLVEIARAIGADARVLIMDEPTASLTEEDTSNLFDVIRGLRSHGVGIIYISHRLEELPVIADRVTVLRDGCTVASRQMADMDRRELIRLMVGRELNSVFPKKPAARGKIVLDIRGLGCRATGVHGVNLSVREGEIVGLAGLVGAGRTETARTLFGLTPADEGQIMLGGEPVTIDSPVRAIEHGIAYLPEDRRRHGVIPEMSVSANITLASLDKLSRSLSMDFSREREVTTDYIRQFSIKAPSIFSAVSTLSGGNQQKVALSRWLATKPRVLILDEPTQGIDVGAKAEIHALMSELAQQGAAILMISSDLLEIMGMSDRIAVMCGGTIVETLDRGEATPERILELALHPARGIGN